MTAATATILDRRKRLLGPAYRLFYEEPLHLVRGEGVWLFDAAGKRYLDMYNNVPHVGHCHPHVVDAVAKQLATLNTHTRYLHENILDYAERLQATLPPAIDTVMFACTGSEANELAIRIAKSATGATGIIATEFAYHGNSQATYEISLEDIPADDVPPHVVGVPFPDTFRGDYRDADAGASYAHHLRHAVDTLASRGIKPAAFIVDTILSSSGVVQPPAGYLNAAAAIIRGCGGVFIADEVQPGLGRTGDHFWGFAADNVVPDIVTMGKPLGNGHPLSAVAVRRELIDSFSATSSYFNTFGGNPVSCAAGLAVLDVLEQEQLQKNAKSVSEHIVRGLHSLAEEYPIIGNIRAAGLFIAVDLVRDRETREPAPAAPVVNGLRARGVLAGSIGRYDNIVKLRPPMVFSIDHADKALAVFDDTLRNL